MGDRVHGADVAPESSALQICTEVRSRVIEAFFALAAEIIIA
jgi:hypothetical protein